MKEKWKFLDNLIAMIRKSGEAVLIGVAYKEKICGCKVTGNGTLKYPLTVKH